MIAPFHHQDDPILLSEEQKRCLFESLAFNQLDARQMTIKAAHTKTCKWLLKHEQYLAWNDAAQLAQHHGFLWIKGKAGAGKSTLMKFAMINARKTMKDFVIISFFFNARGEALEKSVMGAYRSLLFQLLNYIPSLQNIFHSLGLLNPKAAQRWTLDSLQTLLEQAVRSLGQSSIVCFIDALDECDEKQVRDMLQFFEHIGKIALLTKARFQVCFSSRHYPHITIEHGVDLLLDGQEGHKQDISDYVVSELRIGHGKIAQQVRAELQEKASGVFMWVVLVVGILNKEADRGQTRKLRQNLQEIPGDLNDLFRDILTRDSHNREELILCIQWVLFAKMPLKPEQLYYGIFSGLEGEVVTRWDPEETTQNMIQRFILDSSKGLAETTASKNKTVQFIHESVRDFLLKEDSLGQIWPEYACNFHGQSHDSLKQCCLKYMSIDLGEFLRLLDAPSLKGDIRKSTTQTHPLLNYVVHHVLYHADAAEGHGISQFKFLDSFPRSTWVKLANLLERHDVRKHTADVSLLYILSELDMANLVRVLYPTSDCMQVETERYGCPVFAAAAMNATNVLDIFLASGDLQHPKQRPDAYEGKRKSQALEQRSVGRQFVYSKSKDFLWNAVDLRHDGVLALSIRSGRFDFNSVGPGCRCLLATAFERSLMLSVWSLLDAGAILLNNSPYDRNVLSDAAEREYNAFIEALLETGADINVCDPHGAALKAASAMNYKETVLLLLERGADVNAAQSIYSDNALQTAFMAGHMDIATLLLDGGADINAFNSKYGSPLHFAATRGSTEIAALLLERGADMTAKFGRHGDVLQTAVANGYGEITSMLIERGANVNTQGGYYGNALQAAVAGGFKEIAILLLKCGADAHAAGGYYGSALQAASAKGYKDIASMLLKGDVDVNASHGCYGTALWAASYVGNVELVRLLLDNGADVNAHRGICGNTLHAASYTENTELVQLLLDGGADIHGQSRYYASALQTACYLGHSKVVKMLLDNGADVNGQGGRYGNALQAASYYGEPEVIQMLLNHTVDVNAQGGLYGSALQAAALFAKEDIIQLLLENGADANAQGGVYNSALQAASFVHRKEVVELLLEHGASVSAKGGSFGNALHAASLSSWDLENRKTVIDILKKAGASGTSP